MIIYSLHHITVFKYKNNAILSNSFYKNYNIQTYSDTVPVSNITSEITVNYKLMINRKPLY